MSRSFGDHCAAQVGCVAEPEVLEMNLSETDKFIVIASDGVWEFLSNDEVVRIVEPFYQ
jgi:serine/threonine protein phosphatase PrpC